jgi:hypothetical protein
MQCSGELLLLTNAGNPRAKALSLEIRSDLIRSDQIRSELKLELSSMQQHDGHLVRLGTLASCPSAVADM